MKLLFPPWSKIALVLTLFLGVLVACDYFRVSASERSTPTADSPPTPETTADHAPASTAARRSETTTVEQPAFQERGGQVVMEAEHFTDKRPGQGEADSHEWQLTEQPSGFTGMGAMEAAPMQGFNSGNEAIGPSLHFTILFETPGSYYVFLRGYAPEEGGSEARNHDALFVGLDGEPVGTYVSGWTATGWSWRSRQAEDGRDPVIEIPEPGLYTFNVWMRKDGLHLDKIWLDQEPDSVANHDESDGPPESPRLEVTGERASREQARTTATPEAPRGDRQGRLPGVATQYLPFVQSPTVLRLVRPYAANSVWNTAIGDAPRYDPHSEEMVAHIGSSPNGGVITADTSQYTYPVYFANSSTPRHDVPCTQFNCTMVRLEGVSRVERLDNVPIPDRARPSSGSDGQMIIIDETNGMEYNLWQVKRSNNRWTVSNASVYNILWDGAPSEYGSRGAGVPYYAGLIRPWEIERGRIEHAIAFAYPNPAKERCVFPASKTDGQSSDRYALPEGARIQLDPLLTEADFEQMGLDRTGKIIARALQEYGMILIDVSGRPKIYAEDLDSNPYVKESWADPALNLTSETIANIPYDAFKVLALPVAYWDSTAPSTAHGECYHYP